MNTEFKKFVYRFNKNSDSKPASLSNIASLEKCLNILLPTDYKEFLQNYGDLWTPNIVKIIVDNHLPINDVQDFWDTEKIIYDKSNEWTSNLNFDIIPFASDC